MRRLLKSELIELIQKYDEGAGLFLLEHQMELNSGAMDLKGFFMWDFFTPYLPYSFWEELHETIKRKGGYEH